MTQTNQQDISNAFFAGNSNFIEDQDFSIENMPSMDLIPNIQLPVLQKQNAVEPLKIIHPEYSSIEEIKDQRSQVLRQAFGLDKDMSSNEIELELIAQLNALNRAAS